jgi:hypothetical protein
MWHVDILLVLFGISFSDANSIGIPLFYFLSVDNMDFSDLSFTHVIIATLYNVHSTIGATVTTHTQCGTWTFYWFHLVSLFLIRMTASAYVPLFYLFSVDNMDLSDLFLLVIIATLCKV